MNRWTHGNLEKLMRELQDSTGPGLKDKKNPFSQCMQICNHLIHLLLGEAIAHWGHHVAAADDGLFHKPVIGDQSARQIFFLKHAF